MFISNRVAWEQILLVSPQRAYSEVLARPFKGYIIGVSCFSTHARWFDFWSNGTMLKVGSSEKNPLFSVVLIERYSNGTREFICHLWRVFTANFILLLPNISEENRYDLHENERVFKTHFLYGWLHIGDVWEQAKGRQAAGPVILQPFALNYDNLDFGRV